MSDFEDILKDSVESLANDIVIKAKLEPVTTKIAQTYKIYCVAKTALKVGGHVSYGNYYSAAGQIVQFLAIDQMSNAASEWIIEKGGFVSTVEVADSGLIITADIIEDVQKPLSSRWFKIINDEFEGIEDFDTHHKAILNRSYQAEIQAAYAQEQAILAASFAKRQAPPAMIRNLITFIPSIEVLLYGDELKFGVRRYPESTIYRGTLFGEKREGYGILQSESAGTYAGMWREDEAFGYGVRLFPNGVEYRGEYVRPQDQKYSGRNSGVSTHRRSGAKYTGEHDRNRYHGFNMIPDGYGLGYMKNRRLKGIWEEGIFIQHWESKEDIENMGRKMKSYIEAGKPMPKWETTKEEKIETPFNDIKKYLKTGSSIFLDGSFF